VCGGVHGLGPLRGLKSVVRVCACVWLKRRHKAPPATPAARPPFPPAGHAPPSALAAPAPLPVHIAARFDCMDDEGKSGTSRAIPTILYLPPLPPAPLPTNSPFGPPPPNPPPGPPPPNFPPPPPPPDLLRRDAV
jgi:hypothetical protein